MRRPEPHIVEGQAADDVDQSVLLRLPSLNIRKQLVVEEYDLALPHVDLGHLDLATMRNGQLAPVVDQLVIRVGDMPATPTVFRALLGHSPMS